MKKIKCKVCGTRFAGTKEALYLATEKTAFLTALTTPVKAFECFDCPKCGCQNAVNVRMAAVMDSGDEEDEADG
jgi:predicted nucleic-acid-binding Zn-ribbon protein